MLETSYPPQVFLGVHFVLFGFDPITKSKVRFKLVSGGGVDVGQYNRSCTHVIVDKLVYDDPVCTAAQNDGKTLVTALWVDHSADIGMPVDATSVMYRPLKDLNGIPGAKNLIVCLTGYQRQDRDDIMTMVGLMGAQFSKPLMANKVTHLICYKFEGEKYELAKRLKTIKLINHRWLEDCLKDWVLLPEEKYNKSGYELEVMEAEAKDSEEEAENSTLGQSEGRNINKGSPCSKFGIAITHELPKSVREASNAFPDSTTPEGLLKSNKVEDSLFIPGNENRSDQALSFHCVDDVKINCQDTGVSRHATSCQLPNTYFNTPAPGNADVPKASLDLGISENASSSRKLPDLHSGTSESRKLVDDFRSNSESAKELGHSEAKIGDITYSRKNTRRFTLPMSVDESSGNVTGPSASPSYDLKSGNGLVTSSSNVERARDGISSSCVEGSGRGDDFINGVEPNSLLPQKRITKASSTKLKSRKMTPEAKLSVERIPSTNGKIQGLNLISLIVEPPVTEGHISVCKEAIKNSRASSISKSAAFTSNSQVFDVPFSKSATSESAQFDNACQNSAQTFDRSLGESIINDKPFTAGIGLGEVAHDGKQAEPQNVKKDLECSSPSINKSQNEESTSLTNSNLCNKISDKLVRKPSCKKTVSKRSLGSRPKLGATSKQKGSFSLNKSTLQGDGVSDSSRCKETATCDAKKLQASPRIVDVEKSLEQGNVSKSSEHAASKNEFLDDKTEAPDDKCEYELGMLLDEKKSESIHLSKEADTTTEQKSEAILHITKREEATPPKKGTNATEKQKALELVDSTFKEKEKHKGRKRPAGRTKMKTTVAKDVSKSEEAVGGVKIHYERKDDIEMETLENVSLPSAKNDSLIALTIKSQNFFGLEKENRPIDGEEDKGKDKNVGNSAIKSSLQPAKINEMAKKRGLSSSITEEKKRVKTEAICFILSGHRLQRKEFQLVIRRLKARVCRDSHQWSYQATHFIAPDPIRRTEKFFAAASSGRWILKSDYLTASNQAGKFLAEEPYEWHKNGLSEDGAINMEAPRKWRLLKERTGHGAFYGMRIIIYGDCIVPPLDTLKRVIKAGDGTILATSPPYTRFLDSEIDYAIVSPGMPRVDLWVKEFLKHEIPCVVADYLVEYVCKPGFSLERHVLYGTQAWAERSYVNLQSRAEEILEELISPENHDDNDTVCQTCGSRDRGDVMLICGYKSGSVGCGVGKHIGCCDPPLKDVPEDDWFCPKCSKLRNCSNSPRKRKKGILSSSKMK